MTSISAGSQHPQSLSPPHAKTTIACRGPRRSPTRNTATTGPIGSRSPCSSIPDCRRHEAFESGNPRDAYSSVSHLKGNLDSLCFAIGLREDGGQEGALERLLPMLKIQPRPPGEGGRRGDKSRDKGYMECEHPDCIAREDKIRKLQELIEEEEDGLDRLTSEIETLNDRYTSASAEVETLDDKIDIAMTKRVEIDTRNDELQSIVDEAESRKRQLQEQVDELKKEVADLSERLEARDKERREQEMAREMLDSAHMVFRRLSPEEAASEEVMAVRALPDFAGPEKG